MKSAVGYNYRLSNVLTGIGRGQMEVLDQHIEQRRKNFAFYKEHLSEFEGISFLEEPDSRFYSNHWLTCITLDPKKTGGITREDLRLSLEKKNIEARPLWKPMHPQPVFKPYPFYDEGISERLFERGLCLPSGSNMVDEDRIRVVDTIRKVFLFR